MSGRRQGDVDSADVCELTVREKREQESAANTGVVILKKTNKAII